MPSTTTNHNFLTADLPKPIKKVLLGLLFLLLASAWIETSLIIIMAGFYYTYGNNAALLATQTAIILASYEVLVGGPIYLFEHKHGRSTKRSMLLSQLLLVAVIFFITVVLVFS